MLQSLYYYLINIVNIKIQSFQCLLLDYTALLWRHLIYSDSSVGENKESLFI